MLFVEDAYDGKVIIGCSEESTRGRMTSAQELSAMIPLSEEAGGYFSVSYENQVELGRILSMLRDARLPFLQFDSSWSAGDVFASLREEGIVEGEIETVCWRGPGLPIFDRL